jgi:hypothetical protein
MAEYIFDAVAVVGKDKNDKPKFLKVGAVFKSEKGMSLKLDCVPMGNEFNGWIQFYPPKDKAEAPKKPAATKPADFDDDAGF